jgi:hypothetical protein
LSIADQVDQPAGERRGSRLVTGDHQLLEDREQLGIVERPLAIDLGVDQIRQQIVARAGAALVDLDLHRALEFDNLGGAFELALLADHPAEAIGEGIRPAFHRGEVGAVDADLFGDQLHRQRHRKIVDEFAGAPGDKAVDQASDDRANMRLQRIDPLHREGEVDQLAKARVIGRIGGQQRVALRPALFENRDDIGIGRAHARQDR